MNEENNVTPILKHNNRQSVVLCFSAYFKLAFFRASPEDLPYQLSCLLRAAIAYCAISFFLLDAHSSTPDVLIQIIIEFGLLALFLKVGLKIINKPERFFQSFSALVGIGMIISLVSVPIYTLFIPSFLQGHDLTPSAINVAVLLLIWNLAVISYIFKRCFDISTLMSAVLAFNYLIAFELIIISLSTGSK